MTFYRANTRKLIETLNDLIRIHNDRIAGYEHAMEQLTYIDTDLQNEFDKIIVKSKCYKQQLLQKTNELTGSDRVHAVSNIYGKIYRAWKDLKVAFAGNTQKAIINSCLYNEEVALYAYRAALSANIEMAEETRQLIDKQANELKKVHEMIKKYRESRHTISLNTLYFT